MNLVGKQVVKTSYSVDSETNILTVTFKDYLDVVIDSIVIENTKYASLVKALDIVASERLSADDIQLGHRTIYLKQSLEATTTFL